MEARWARLVKVKSGSVCCALIASPLSSSYKQFRISMRFARKRVSMRNKQIIITLNIRLLSRPIIRNFWAHICKLRDAIWCSSNSSHFKTVDSISSNWKKKKSWFTSLVGSWISANKNNCTFSSSFRRRSQAWAKCKHTLSLDSWDNIIHSLKAAIAPALKQVRIVWMKLNTTCLFLSKLVNFRSTMTILLPGYRNLNSPGTITIRRTFFDIRRVKNLYLTF